MSARHAGRNAAVAAGAAVAVAGAALVAQKVAARRVRRLPDGDAARALETPIYVDHRLDTHDRGAIYVVEEGTGPAVVLSHGVTLSVRTWFHQLELLPKEGLRTIAFDHRGHGQSVLGDDGHSLDALAEDIKTVVLGLDLRDAILVGHSMGGVAVQSFLIRYPDLTRERIKGVVLLSTLAKSPLGSQSTRMKARIEKWFKRVPDTTPLWANPDLGLVLANVGFGTDARPSHVELVRQMMHSCSARTRSEAPRVLVGLDFTDDLPKIDVPTLVIGGTADVLTPPACSKQIAELVPNARLELIEGAGHLVMLERADELNKMIIDFAREVGAL